MHIHPVYGWAPSNKHYYTGMTIVCSKVNWTSFSRHSCFVCITANGPVSQHDQSIRVYHTVQVKRCKLQSIICLLLDDIKCNGTDNNTAFVGDIITYSCSFKYQGILDKDAVIWRDHLGLDVNQEAHSLFNATVPFAKPGTCYKGESAVRKPHNCFTGRQ